MTFLLFKGLLVSFSLIPEIYTEYLSMFNNIQIYFQKHKYNRDHVQILKY